MMQENFSESEEEEDDDEAPPERMAIEVEPENKGTEIRLEGIAGCRESCHMDLLVVIRCTGSRFFLFVWPILLLCKVIRRHQSHARLRHRAGCGNMGQH